MLRRSRSWRARAVGLAVLAAVPALPAAPVPAGATAAARPEPERAPGGPRVDAPLPAETRRPGAFQGLAGQLLVATSLIRDPRFEQTVIYMVRHGPTGAMGVVINRQLAEVPLARVLEETGQPSVNVPGRIRVHYGGPVEVARGLVLHTAEYVGEGTMRIDDHVSLTADPEILRDLAAGVGPRRSLFILGYAGWGPNQLEEEMARGAWVAVPSDEAIVFGDHYDEKWQKAMARHGIKL